MPKLFKYIGYVFLFAFSFVVFLYWTFPYGILKERLITAIEQQLGGEYDVRVADFSPSFFTGAVLKQVKIVKHDADKTVPIWQAQKVKIRAGLGSLLFGGTNIKFSAKSQKSYFSGSFKKTDDGFIFSCDLDDFNIGDFGFLAGDSGLQLVSSINGTAKLSINNKQMIQSSGTIDLSLDDIKINAGELKLGEGGTFQLPELLLSKGSGSSLKLEFSKGAMHVKEFKLQDGDLKFNLLGDIYTSAVFKNYRMNLNGNFSVSPKMEEALPLLYMMEKQKSADGSYPVTITGRIAQPAIKVGEFTLPL